MRLVGTGTTVAQEHAHAATESHATDCPSTESQIFLYETLIDLAASADRQAARAADVYETRVSAILFALADELRTMARQVKDADPGPESYALLDSGRSTIAVAMLKIDSKAYRSFTR